MVVRNIDIDRKIAKFTKIAVFFLVLWELCILASGVINMWSTPPSVDGFGISGPLKFVWITMLIGGSLVFLYGTFLARGRTRASLQVWGSSMSLGGFVIWAIASLFRPDPSPASLSLVFVYLACVFAKAFYITFAAMVGKR